MVCLWPLLASCQQSDACVVGTEEVKKASENDIVLVDVRTDKEFDQGHVKNALHYDVLQSGFSEAIENLDKNKKYYVYCRSGRRSAKAQQIMQKEGFTDVCNVEGGAIQLGKEGVPMVH